MEGSDDCEARTAVGEVINIADERFSTMIAAANPLRSAWARNFSSSTGVGDTTPPAIQENHKGRHGWS